MSDQIPLTDAGGSSSRHKPHVPPPVRRWWGRHPAVDFSTVLLVVVTGILVITLALSINGIRQHAADVALQQTQAKDLLIVEEAYSELRSQIYSLGHTPSEPSAATLFGPTSLGTASTFHIGKMTVKCVEVGGSGSVYTCTATEGST